jgi:hypothetical protein
MLKLRGYDGINKLINEFSQKLVEELQDRAPDSSGELSDSITFKVTTDNNQFEAGIFMAEYGIFQDRGVNGSELFRGSEFTFRKMPPPKVFDKWILRTGIAPRDKEGKFMSRKSLSFLIARSIFKKGLPAKNWINPNSDLDIKLDDISFRIADLIWDDFYDEHNTKK